MKYTEVYEYLKVLNHWLIFFFTKSNKNKKGSLIGLEYSEISKV